MCNKQHKFVRQVIEMSEPSDWNPVVTQPLAIYCGVLVGDDLTLHAERPGLELAEMRTHFDEMQRSVFEAVEVVKDTEDVSTQCATTRAKLDDLQWFGGAKFGPLVEEPDGDHRSENLAELWRGYEVTTFFEHVFVHVVARGRVEEYFFHVFSDCDGANHFDAGVEGPR